MNTVTLPEFLVLTYDDLPVTPTRVWTHSWLVGQTFPTLKSLLAALGYNNVETYSTPTCEVAIVIGTNNKYRLEARIKTKGTFFYTYGLTSVQGFFFSGALTFEQYKDVATRFQSVNGFNFRACNFTQPQLEELATIILGVDKHGRDLADFRFNKFPISNTLFCKFRFAGWLRVRGQSIIC